MPHAERLQFFLAALVLTAALVLGGGQGALGDTAVQLLALALLAAVFWRHATDGEARLPRTAWLAAVPLAVVLLQLFPLPEFLWRLPEARPGLANELAAASVEGLQRWSLVPVATERAGHWLLPAVALFLAALQLPRRPTKTLLTLLVAVAAVSVVLGLAQLFGGADSPLRFYDITNVRSSVGFFANRNHQASLLALCLPLVVVGTMAWYQKRETGQPHTWLGVAAGVGLLALFILGIAITLSRAGLLLGMAGLLLSVPLVLVMRRRRGTRRTLALAVAVGFLLVMQFALFGILQRLGQDPLQDTRFALLPVVTETARQHSPLGAGLGGFRRAFEAEHQTPEREYINHAHNDWLEMWVDAGPMAPLLALGGLACLVVASWRTWPRRTDASSARGKVPALVAGLGLWLLALHSLGDYPLRTTALLATAGLLAGVAARRHWHPPAKPRESHLPDDEHRPRLEAMFNQ